MECAKSKKGLTLRSTLEETKPVILRNNHVAMLVAAALSATGCEQPVFHSPADSNPDIATTAHYLTIKDLSPPVMPFVLPLQNGIATRVSQKAGENCPRDCSHYYNSTRRAVDFSDETFAPDRGSESGLVLAPLAGTVHLAPDPKWGNVVELEGRDGAVYISAHCANYRNEAPDRNEAPEGSFVLKGTPLCRIGNTGTSSHGLHLHFDKVIKTGRPSPSQYESVGVERYITKRADGAIPFLQTPDDFQTCCNTCTTTPRSPNCAEYISFNRPSMQFLADRWQEIKNTIPPHPLFPRDKEPENPTQPDENPIQPDAERSQRYSPWVYAYKEITVRVNGIEKPGRVEFAIGSPSGAGQRNPFIDIVYSAVHDSAVTNWSWDAAPRTLIHSEKFVDFDLWDFANTFIGSSEREQLPDKALTFTQSAQLEHWNFDKDWELWKTRFNIHGENPNFYLAVSKQNRGYRFAGTYYPNGNWSGWYMM